MKNCKMQDERIVLQKQKIANDAFGILLYGLLLCILIQQFAFNAPFSQYAAEWILFLIAAFYITIRNIMVGNNLFANHNKGQKMVLTNSIVSGITIAIVATTLNTIRLGLDKMGGVNHMIAIALICFACGTIPSFVVWEAIYLINQKRQKQLDNKYCTE